MATFGSHSPRRTSSNREITSAIGGRGEATKSSPTLHKAGC
jgi:hypothetical protein